MLCLYFNINWENQKKKASIEANHYEETFYTKIVYRYWRTETLWLQECLLAIYYLLIAQDLQPKEIKEHIFSINGIISAWQICHNCCLLVNCGKLPLKANCTLCKAYDRYIIKSSKKPQFLDIFFVRRFEYINSVKSTGQALDATFS